MGRPAHTMPRGRGRPRLTRFHKALLISAVFHLSMVTLFRIVIYFPHEQIRYYQFQIVEMPAASAQTETAPPLTETPRLRDPLGGALPDVSLPTLEFAELRRLRVRGQQDDAALFDGAGPDQRLLPGLTERLERIGDTLARLRLPGQDDAQLEGEADTPRRLRHRPARGYVAAIEWSMPPYDRELLFSPPIQALYDASPEDIPATIEVVFTVTPSGRVVNVWSPTVDPTGIVESVQAAILRYRFAPVTDPEADEQMATLYLRPERPQE